MVPPCHDVILWLCFLVIFSAFSLSSKNNISSVIVFSLSRVFFFLFLYGISVTRKTDVPLSHFLTFCLSNWQPLVLDKLLCFSEYPVKEPQKKEMLPKLTWLHQQRTKLQRVNFLMCVCVSAALKYSVALCQQKCKRRGTLESNYCSSNFGETINVFFIYIQ